MILECVVQKVQVLPLVLKDTTGFNFSLFLRLVSELFRSRLVHSLETRTKCNTGEQIRSVDNSVGPGFDGRTLVIKIRKNV